MPFTSGDRRAPLGLRNVPWKLLGIYILGLLAVYAVVVSGILAFQGLQGEPPLVRSDYPRLKAKFFADLRDLKKGLGSPRHLQLLADADLAVSDVNRISAEYRSAKEAKADAYKLRALADSYSRAVVRVWLFRLEYKNLIIFIEGSSPTNVVDLEREARDRAMEDAEELRAAISAVTESPEFNAYTTAIANLEAALRPTMQHMFQSILNRYTEAEKTALIAKAARTAIESNLPEPGTWLLPIVVKSGADS